jgi:hypothetical protein
MKSKLAAMAACLLLGGLASLAQAQSAIGKRCSLAGGVIACGPTAACHCNSGSATVVTPQPQSVGATWCRDRGPTC